VALRAEGAIGDALLLLEHPHVYTLGRRGKHSDVLLSPEALAKLGVPLVETDRGGEVTYHGPGQLVAYPVLDLRESGGPVAYVRSLEAALVAALGSLGVPACTLPGLTGVWVRGGAGRADRKIGAIGVRITRGVSSHGFALNVNTDLSYFQHIVACGIEGLEVTSVARELGGKVDLGRVGQEVAGALAHEWGVALRWAGPEETERLLEGATPVPEARSR
jgi:lipoyl(octanoyl) transferase